MLKFIIIGMMCNGYECYWSVADKTVYDNYQECRQVADNLRNHSIMYFRTDCLVKYE